MQHAFDKAEVVYYLVVFLVGSLGGLFRLLRDDDFSSVVQWTGSSLSAGLLGFGIVGIWIGRDPSGNSSNFYYLAASALIGFYSVELQDFVFERIIKESLRRVGIIKAKDGSVAD